MNDRRRAERMAVDLCITKHMGQTAVTGRACEISPSGIRLRRAVMETGEATYEVSIELPLVEGKLTTCIPSRRIWIDDIYEAFAFTGASFAQQVMLERIFGNV
ncbi:MAG: PilZ domain-containing protein [Myxococcota bacterium]|jgi:hypothetical protein|nr:PilZ domain-containing protein [Myxococcota bacterium]